MKLKQQNIKAFEITIDDEQQFRSYLVKNAPLLQGHLLALTNLPSEDLSLFLKEQNFCFVSTQQCTLDSRKRSQPKISESEPSEPEVEKENNIEDNTKELVEESTEKNVEEKIVLHRPVRSGETIETNGDMVVFGRINSGSRLNIGGNGEFFDTIDGNISCEGDYILIKSIGKGNVIFNSETVDKSALKGSLHLITYKDALVIKEIS